MGNFCMLGMVVWKGDVCLLWVVILVLVEWW